MKAVFTIPITRENLLEMKAGNRELRIEFKNEETGEVSEFEIKITPDQIDQILRSMEAVDRASRN